MRAVQTRRKKFPAPAWVSHQLLADPADPFHDRPWLHLKPGEIAPIVLESDPPGSLVWSSLWPDRPDDLIRFDLTDDEIRWTLLSPDAGPDEAAAGLMRHRLDFLIFANLRFTLG